MAQPHCTVRLTLLAEITPIQYLDRPAYRYDTWSNLLTSYHFCDMETKSGKIPINHRKPQKIAENIPNNTRSIFIRRFIFSAYVKMFNNISSVVNFDVRYIEKAVKLNRVPSIHNII